MRLFRKAADFAAMERVMEEAVERTGIRILAYCLISNHWHFLLWPLEMPGDWLRWVQEPQTEGELDAIRRSVVRGRPFGGDRWARRTAKRFGLESTFRPQGRPRKKVQA